MSTSANIQLGPAPDNQAPRLGENHLFVDPHIWRKSGLSRSEFLRRVRGLHKIRRSEVAAESQVMETLPVFSFFPRTLESFTLLERLHNLVNKADFSVFDERTNEFVVAVALPPKLSAWLLNARIATVQKQIFNWLAAWLTGHSALPDQTRVAVLPRQILDEVDKIKTAHYRSGEQCHPDRLALIPMV